MCYCHFCGFANCEKCLKKTRYFFEDVFSYQKFLQQPLNYKPNHDRERGKICHLCDRKFLWHRLRYKLRETFDASDQ